MAASPKRPPASDREAERMAGLWLTPKDLARELQMNERTVVRYLEQGKLPGRKIGTKWRTSRAQLDALAAPIPKERD